MTASALHYAAAVQIIAGLRGETEDAVREVVRDYPTALGIIACLPSCDGELAEGLVDRRALYLRALGVAA